MHCSEIAEAEAAGSSHACSRAKALALAAALAPQGHTCIAPVDKVNAVAAWGEAVLGPEPLVEVPAALHDCVKAGEVELKV